MQFGLLTLMTVTMSTSSYLVLVHGGIWFSNGHCYVEVHRSSKRFSSQILFSAQVSSLRVHASALYRLMSLINVLQVLILTWLLGKNRIAKYALFALFILSTTVLMSLLAFNNVPRYRNSQQCWRCIVRFCSLHFPCGAYHCSLSSKKITVPLGVTLIRPQYVGS